MNNNDKQTISITEATQNTKMADKIENDTLIEMTDDEKIDFIAKKILHKYRRAFEELAK